MKGSQSGTQGQNLEGGAESEVMEECCSLFCLLISNSTTYVIIHRTIFPEIILPAAALAFPYQPAIKNAS